MIHTQMKILLVDDDANERSGVRFLIERASMPLTILEAPNGKRALDLLRQNPVDILFTDVKMPYMDGLELSATVYHEFPQIKIIVFSAYGEFEYAKKAMEAKAFNYLLKPIDVAEFEAVMAAVIQRCQEERTLAKQRQRRIQADRKLQWINLLTGKQPVTEALLEELDAKGYPIEQGVLLLHMETQRDFFSAYEPSLLKCLTENIPCHYEYVNLYPNSSYIILFAKMHREKICALCEKLEDCAEGNGDQASFFVDDTSFTLKELAKHVRKMDEISRQMFVWDAGTLFQSDLAQLTQAGFAEVDAVWRQSSDAIVSRSKDVILSSFHNLLDAMNSHGLFSAAYIHHIFCDLFGKLYTEYGYTDSQGMRRAMRQLSVCRSKQALMRLTGTVLEEVSRKPGEEQDVSYVVHKVKRIIRNEYSQDISLDYLAKSVGLAPSYLSYVFKRETGENLIKYLTDYRMEKAKQMLDDGSVKIIQVAKQCGYENQSYFNRLFKNTYGLTPSQYREKNNG